MNKKQKVLTAIALIAFVVIGACHYLAWPPLLLYGYKSVPLTVWEELTYEEVQQQNDERMDLIFIARLLEQGGYTDAKGTYHTYRKDDPAVSVGAIPVDAKLWFPVETKGTQRFWNPRINGVTYQTYAMVFDVRIPWFMLGVTYVGLFFLLADRKEKR